MVGLPEPERGTPNKSLGCLLIADTGKSNCRQFRVKAMFADQEMAESGFLPEAYVQATAWPKQAGFLQVPGFSW